MRGASPNGRRVHFFVYGMNQLGTDVPIACRNVVAENYALLHPLAT